MQKLLDSNDHLKLMTQNSYTPVPVITSNTFRNEMKIETNPIPEIIKKSTSIIFSSPNSKKVKLVIPDLNQIKNDGNKSAISSPKKMINLSPIQTEKSLTYQKNYLQSKSPNEKMLKTGGFNMRNVSSNQKNVNGSFLKSNSLSPKKI